MKVLIGNSDPVCPHCSAQLSKMPVRKTKCGSCGNEIYVRTSPIDRQKVLVTAEGAARIEEEWKWRLPAPRPQRPPIEEFNREVIALTEKFGRAPSEADIYWSLANKNLLLHATQNNWGLYRNVRFDMAEILRGEAKDRQALDVYLEVSYLDSNGPQNLGGIKGFPPFTREDAFQAPFIVEAIAKLSRQQEIDGDGIKAAFLLVATAQKMHLKLPVAPERAYEQLKTELAKIYGADHCAQHGAPANCPAASRPTGD